MKKSAIISIITLLTIMIISGCGIIAINKYQHQNSDSEQTNTEDTYVWGSTETSAIDSKNTYGSSDTFDGTEPILRKIGEELPVDLLQPREQGEKPPSNKEAFGYWTGKMTFTVNSATLYKDFESTGIDADLATLNYDDYSSDGYKPLVINMTINNVNATSNTGGKFYSDIFMFSTKDEFYSENFEGDKNASDWSLHDNYLAYVSNHSDGDDYFLYDISQGKSVEMTLCYFFKADEMSLSELYLGLVTYSYCHSFGIELDKIEDKR